MAADAKRTVNILINVTGDAAVKFQNIASGLQKVSDALTNTANSIAASGRGLQDFANSLSKIAGNVPDLSGFSKEVSKLAKIDSSQLTAFVEAAKGLKDVKVSSSFTTMTEGIKSLSGITRLPDLTKFAASTAALSTAIGGLKSKGLTDLSTALSSFAGVAIPSPTKISNFAAGLKTLSNVDTGKINSANLAKLSEALTMFTAIKGLPAAATFTGFTTGIKNLSSFTLTTSQIKNLESLATVLPKFQGITTGLPTAKRLTDFQVGIKKLAGVEVKDPAKLAAFAESLRAFSGIKGLPNLTNFSTSLAAIQKIDVSGIKTFVAEVDKLTASLKALSAVAPNLAVFSRVASTAQATSGALQQASAAANANAQANQNAAQGAQNLANAQQQVPGPVNKATSAFQKLQKAIATYTKYRLIADSIIYLKEAFTAGLTAIIDYDQALKDLQAITGATQVEVEQMGEKIIEVATKTKFSAAEVAAGMRTLGQAGFTAGEAVQAMQGISDLATGTLSEMASTVDLVTTALRVFNLDAANASKVADIFGNAVNRSKLTVDKLRISMNYVGPIARDVGVTLEETSAAMMTLANSGLRASTIGTGLRRVFAELSDPSEKLINAANRVGVAIQDIDPQSNSLSDVLRNLGLVVKDTATAFDVFGKRGAASILALTSQESQFENMLTTVSKSGTAAEMAATQMEGLGIGLKNLRDRFGVLAISLGNNGIVGVMRVFVAVVKTAVEAITALSDSTIGALITQLSILTVAGLAVAAVFKTLGATTLITTFGKLTVSTYSLTSAFIAARAAALGLSATPPFLIFTGVLVALGLVIGALKLAFDKLSDSSENFTEKAGEALKLSDIYKQNAKAVQEYRIAVASMEEGSKANLDANLRLRESLRQVAEGTGEAANAAYLAMQSINGLNGEISDTTALDNYYALVSKLADAKLAEAFNLQTAALENQLNKIKQFNAEMNTNQSYSAEDASMPTYDNSEAAQAARSMAKGLLENRKTWAEYTAYVTDLLNKLPSELNAKEKSHIDNFKTQVESAQAALVALGQHGVNAASSTREEMLKQAKLYGFIKDEGSLAAQTLASEFDKTKESISFDGVVDKWKSDIDKQRTGILELTEAYKTHGKEVTNEQMEKLAALDLEKQVILASRELLDQQHEEDLKKAGITADEKTAINAKYWSDRIALDNAGHAIEAQLSELEVIQVAKSLEKIRKLRDKELAENKARYGAGSLTENLNEFARQTALINDRFAKSEAEILKTVLNPADVVTLYEDSAEKIVTAYKGILLQLSLLEANGVLSHEEAEAEKLQATLNYHDEAVAAAEAFEKQLQALREQGQKVSDTQMKKATKAVEDQRQARLAAELALMTSLKKEVEKGAADIEKAKLAEVKMHRKNTDAILKIETDAADKIAKIDESRVDKIQKIEDKIKKIREKAAADRLKTEQDSTNTIAGLEQTLEDKLRSIKQDKLSETAKKADIEKQYRETVSQASGLISKGVASGDTDLIERGAERAKFAEGLVDSAASYNEQATKLTKLTKLQIDAERALAAIEQKRLKAEEKAEILEVDKERLKVQEDAVEATRDAEKDKKASIQALKQTLADELGVHVDFYKTVEEAEKARHTLEMKNIDEEIAKHEAKKNMYQKLVGVLSGNAPAVQAESKIPTAADPSRGSVTDPETGKTLAKMDATASELSSSLKSVNDEISSIGKSTAQASEEFQKANISGKLTFAKMKDGVWRVSEDEVKDSLQGIQITEPIEVPVRMENIEATAEIRNILGDLNELATKDKTSITFDSSSISETASKISSLYDGLDIVEPKQRLQDMITVMRGMGNASRGTFEDMTKEIVDFASTINGVEIEIDMDSVINPDTAVRGLVRIRDEAGELVDNLNNNLQSNPIGLFPHEFDREIISRLEHVQGAVALAQEQFGEDTNITVETDFIVHKDQAENDIEEVKAEADNVPPYVIPLKADAEPFKQTASNIESSLPDDLKLIIKPDADAVTGTFNTLTSDPKPYVMPFLVRTDTTGSPAEKVHEINRALDGIETDVSQVHLDVDQGELDELNANLENAESTTIEVNGVVTGKEDIIQLQESVNATESKEVTVSADVENGEEVQGLRDNIFDLINKTIYVMANVVGLNKVESLKKAIDGLKDKTVTVTSEVKKVGGTVTGLATGGPVFPRLPSSFITGGSGRVDDVPAMLTRGEFVHKVDAVRKYGTKFMRMINDGIIPPELINRLVSNFSIGGPVLGGLQNMPNLKSPTYFPGAQNQSKATSMVSFTFEDIQYETNPVEMNKLDLDVLMNQFGKRARFAS